jgi:hypothetical protein
MSVQVQTRTTKVYDRAFSVIDDPVAGTILGCSVGMPMCAAGQWNRRLVGGKMSEAFLASRKWPRSADVRRFDAAFADLEANSILAIHNGPCCNTCVGGYLWGEAVPAARQAGRALQGYVFYNEQTSESVAQGGELFLVCGPIPERIVADTEAALGVALPPAYRAFLLLAGRGCGPLEGSQYAIEDELAELQRVGRRIATGAKTTLPDGAFVFLVHQGFVCLFFLCDESDDPVVYECVKGLGPPRSTSLRVSEWLSSEVAKWRAGRGT